MVKTLFNFDESHKSLAAAIAQQPLEQPWQSNSIFYYL